MKIVVTGASGFIGARLVERLLREGHTVTGTGRSDLLERNGHYRYLKLDLGDLAACRRVVAGSDAVVHCAGKAGAWGPRVDFENANVVATRNILRASKSAGARRFVNVSSPSIYFRYGHLFDVKENDIPERMLSDYSETKYRAEMLVEGAHEENFPTISLRPRGVIGAGDRNWLPRIIALRKNNLLTQPGDGSNHVDFTSVENLVDAVILCLNTGVENCGRAYNISNGRPEKFWDFVESFLQQVGLDGNRRRVPTFVALAAARASEKYHRLLRTKAEPSLLPIKVGVATYSMTLDIGDAVALLGYAPRMSTADAIAEFVAWSTSKEFSERQRRS